MPFPKAVRNEWVASGKAQPHHILPDSGWISFFIRQPEDVSRAISLPEQSFQLVLHQAERRHTSQKAESNEPRDNV